MRNIAYKICSDLGLRIFRKMQMVPLAAMIPIMRYRMTITTNPSMLYSWLIGCASL